VLFEALALASQQPADALTHGFHSYPARMHRAIASHLLDKLARPTDRVADPFCGSGTVLVEAERRGLRSMGIDLNPLALRIAEVKTDRRDAPGRARFSDALRSVADASRERVRARAESRAPLTRAQASSFEPHVLRELAGLREEIVSVAHEADRRALEIVLSAILTKVSRRRGDTDDRQTPKRMGRFIPTDIFDRKGQELVERWAALDAACPAVSCAPILRLDDARDLPRITGSEHVDLAVSSPPYAGTYDYSSHHALRLPWLGLQASRLERDEIGARRSVARGGRATWERELVAVLRALASALTGSGLAVLLTGDGQAGKDRIDALAELRQLAPAAGLELVAWAGAPRPDWLGGRPRAEHLVALTRSR